MGTRRAYLGVAALNDCIYSIGGWNETQDALHTVEKYSFEEVGWMISVVSWYSFNVCKICGDALSFTHDIDHLWIIFPFFLSKEETFGAIAFLLLSILFY